MSAISGLGLAPGLRDLHSVFIAGDRYVALKYLYTGSLKFESDGNSIVLHGATQTQY